jgi:hypothetical protein
MIMMKVVGGILAILGMGAFLYLGLVGYLPTPTQVRTDITAAVTHR